VVGFRAGLDSTVIETRFNVLGSALPHRAVTIRRLRDYLPPLDHRDALARSGSVLRETA
jgi:hypothetical protein